MNGQGYDAVVGKNGFQTSCGKCFHHFFHLFMFSLNHCHDCIICKSISWVAEIEHLPVGCTSLCQPANNGIKKQSKKVNGRVEQ